MTEDITLTEDISTPPNPDQKPDPALRLCARCGQPVNRLKDSYKTVGDQIVHGSCPASPEMKAIPAVRVPPGGVQFIRMEDAARMLSVSVKTIQRRIRSGELPAKRLRGAGESKRQTILIDQADVLALLEDYTGAEK